MLRKDTNLLTDAGEMLNMSIDSERSDMSKMRKFRGRKNRYFQQIDNEDNTAGLLLDSDEEGQAANKKAREEHLQKLAEDEAKKEAHEREK